MCVQFLSSKTLDVLSAEYEASVPTPFEWKIEVFPRYLAPVLIYRKNRLEIVPMHFGLIPHFEKDPKPKKVFHNARSETLAQKPSFQKAYRETRCLVPMQAFFESIWETDPNTRKEKSHRVRFFRSRGEQRSLLAAGLWSLWRNPETKVVTAHFTIITREPPPFILEMGHDRSPAFMNPKVIAEWLDPAVHNAGELDQILVRHREDPDWECERVK